MSGDGQFQSGEQVVSLTGSGSAVGTVALTAGQTYQIVVAGLGGAAPNTFEARWAFEGGSSVTTYTALPSASSSLGGIINPGNAAQAGIWGSVYGANTLEQRIYTFAAAPSSTFLDMTGTFPGLLAQAPAPMGNLAVVTSSFATSRNITLSAQGGFNTNALNLTLNGTISTPLAFAGLNGGITKTNNTGTLILNNAANTYTGPTSIRAGTVQAISLANGGVPSSIGESSNAPGNVWLDGGTLQYLGTAAASIDRSFTITTNGGGIDNSSAAATSSLTLASLLAPQLFTLATIGTHLFTLTGSNTGANVFDPPIVDSTGATSLNKSGAGSWTIPNNTNSYTGITSLSAGVLHVTAVNSLGSTAGGTVVSGGGTLEIDGTNFTLPAEPLFLNGTGTAATVGALSAVGSVTVPGVIDIATSAGIGATAASTLTLSGNIRDDGASALSFVGAGNVTASSTISSSSDDYTLSPFTASLYQGTNIDFGTAAASVANLNSAITGSVVGTTALSATVTYNGPINFPSPAAVTWSGIFGSSTAPLFNGITTDTFSTSGSRPSP